MINQREIDYSIALIQAEISYFKKYKKNLKLFFVKNKEVINETKTNKILNEIEHITIHILLLKNQEQEYLQLLDKINYGNYTEL